MSIKRSRTTYEADLQAHSPYVTYGTPLLPQDDGSFVPVWKQEVTDERGRKRLHGAFTGGFSAGYFNTVGSKEGWTPSTFVSSRANRKKVDQNTPQQRAEDFMDDEDLADAADAQRVQTTDGFAALGSTEEEVLGHSAVLDLFMKEGENVGIKLLKRMGWREGQGVGPKLRRHARLDDTGPSRVAADGEIHLFAPENTRMIRFIKKNGSKGLGYDGEPKLVSENRGNMSANSDDENQDFGTAAISKRKTKPGHGGIGIGILNDTGSDDEDPYEIGPRISYNKVIGAGKKKRKPMLNGSARPVFISKKSAMAKSSASLRKCYDGRLPLDGFVLSSDPGSISSIIISDGKHLPPEIPEGWRSEKQPNLEHKSLNYLSAAEAAKASNLDPKTRANLLGEAPLPGKSVFDYLSSTARDRLASASGKTNLPPALGEVPQGYALTDEERKKDLSRQIPKLDKETAVAALARGTSGWMPYADDEGKRTRYREFLETQAGARKSLPQKAPGMKNDEWVKELQEFAHCAQIFKPMTGMMATRFTSSSSALKPTENSSSPTGPQSLLTKPAPKPEDPAEVAAKVGMFGLMTRSSQDFYPTRLLCKRFDVKPPAHVAVDQDMVPETGAGSGSSGSKSRDDTAAKSPDLESTSVINNLLKESGRGNEYWTSRTESAESPPKVVVIDAERNEALEGERAGEAVFNAIFGDDDDDDDS